MANSIRLFPLSLLRIFKRMLSKCLNVSGPVDVSFVKETLFNTNDIFLRKPRVNGMNSL